MAEKWPGEQTLAKITAIRGKLGQGDNFWQKNNSK
jgi:hypothetical protein